MPITALAGGSALAPAARPTLRNGARGQAVRELQQRLGAAGFDPQGVDGAFGPNTEAAVRAFQRSRGLQVDGVVGPKTWGALTGRAPAAPAQPTYAGDAAGRLIGNAMRFLGQPYHWGGGHASRLSHPGPVDCSGLVVQAARWSGLNFDGTAATQQRRGRAVSMNALQPGDLLFHGTPASHVGIYIGDGRAIHASSTYGRVMVVDVKAYGYFDNARRVL